MAIERLVIKSLDFDLYRPTPLVFIDRCVQACQEELGVQTKEVSHCYVTFKVKKQWLVQNRTNGYVDVVSLVDAP